MFIGTFEKSDDKIVPDDSDEFYDFEEKHGCPFWQQVGLRRFDPT